MNADKRILRDKSTREVLDDLYRAKQQKADIVEFVGGETSIRKDFWTLLSAAKKLKIPEIIMATNGRMFSIPGFSERTVKAGLTDLIFSIHGHDKKTHDSLVRSEGAFEQLMEGIRNAKKAGFGSINGNTTVVRQNMKHLKGIGEVYANFGIKNVEWIFVDPNYGGACNHFYKYVPKISEASVYMREALDYGRKRGFGGWKARYVPLCYFPDHLKQISEMIEVKLFLTKHWALDFVNENASESRKTVGRKKPEKCVACRLYRICEGIWVEYLKRYGAGELKPLK